MNDHLFIDRLRENIPPEVEAEDPLEQLRELSQWLLVVPVIMLILLGCGQLALFTTSEAALADTNSNLSAEYGPWPYLQINGFRGEIIEAIKMDGKSTQTSNDTYNDPVEVTSDWVNGELPPIIIAQLPTPGIPGPTSTSRAGAPADPLGTDEPTPSPSATATFWSTATAQPTSTDNPSATRTYTPIPSRTPTRTPTPLPTLPGAPTWTPSPPPTNTSTPTRTPTATNIPTNTPMPTNTPVVTDTPPPPPDYCGNISWNVNKWEDWNPGRAWKYWFSFSNNNSISMYLTSYSMSWTDSGLGLNRAKSINGDPSRPRLLYDKQSSPASNCVSCPVVFPPGGGHEIYNMFCNDVPCDESSTTTDLIPPGTYTFTATGNFNINGVNCGFTKSKTITYP